LSKAGPSKIQSPSKKIAIVGNGPSRANFIAIQDEFEWDDVIGINVYDEALVGVQTVVCADSLAVMMYRNYPLRNRLDDIRFVMSRRAHNGCSTFKNRPASPDTFKDFLDASDLLEAVVECPEEFALDDKQRYLSSGHLAYLYASDKYPDSEIHMFGFDSVFTGDSSATYSNRDIKNYDDPNITRSEVSEKTDFTKVWEEYWIICLSDRFNTFKSVTFYGIDGDRRPEFNSPNMKVAYI